MQRQVFVVAAKGYLYEWFPTPEDGSADGLTASLQGHERIALLKSVLRNRDIFLPPIYREWRERR